MDSDGTLAKVTYLRGVTPPLTNVQQKAAVPSEFTDSSESTGLPETTGLSDTTMRSETSASRVFFLPSEPVALQESTATGDEEAPSERTLRRAENVSLNALTRRGRSRWELGEILIARDLDPGVVDAELDRLERVGLLDDVALAETIVRTQHERKGLGRSALINEMRRKHIDQSAIDAALEHIGDDDEFQRAVQLAERRANQLRGLEHNTAVRRLSGFLQRKGYSGDTVRRVVLEVLPRRSSGVSFS